VRLAWERHQPEDRQRLQAPMQGMLEVANDPAIASVCDFSFTPASASQSQPCACLGAYWIPSAARRPTRHPRPALRTPPRALGGYPFSLMYLVIARCHLTRLETAPDHDHRLCVRAQERLDVPTEVLHAYGRCCRLFPWIECNQKLSRGQPST
jgi:hypothetical protein